MTDKDYELLSQYIDGELAGPEAAALEKRLAGDVQLRTHTQPRTDTRTCARSRLSLITRG